MIPFAGPLWDVLLDTFPAGRFSFHVGWWKWGWHCLWKLNSSGVGMYQFFCQQKLLWLPGGRDHRLQGSLHCKRSRSGLLPILSHSWHFHMYDWGAFLTPNILIEIYPNPGTLTRFQNWTQTQRSWSFTYPSRTFSTAFLVFPSSLPPSTMVISRKWVIREQNHIMCLPLQGFSIFVQLLSSCSQPDLICRLPHNGCHRPHQLHRTHLWQKLLQEICSDSNHPCHLCRHLAICLCHHQSNHLCGQFGWDPGAGRCNVRHLKFVEPGSKPREVVFVFGVITPFLVIFVR